MDESTALVPPRLEPRGLASDDELAPEPRGPRRRSSWLGGVALAFGIATPLVVAAGIATATADAHLTGTVLAYVAIGTSIVAVLTGGMAVIGGWGRGAGIGGIVLGVISNPIVLIRALELLAGGA